MDRAIRKKNDNIVLQSISAVTQGDDLLATEFRAHYWKGVSFLVVFSEASCGKFQGNIIWRKFYYQMNTFFSVNLHQAALNISFFFFLIELTIG